MTTTAAHPLAHLLPPDRISVDPDVLAAHQRDRATFCPAGEPSVLVRARSTEDVSTALAWANSNGVPVVPQGARTGLSGAANASQGCLLLSVEKMDRVLRVDAEEQLAVVEPGVVNADLGRAVAEHGLFYPPDPGSQAISTIGGNIATNAGGMCCVKYGVTGDFVRELEVVLADGTVTVAGGKVVKNVAGYDLGKLYTGSLGTLGVITEVVFRLHPLAAEHRWI